jgi:hypothetical protein
LIADDGFAFESRESLLLKSCVRQNRTREKFERREHRFVPQDQAQAGTKKKPGGAGLFDDCLFRSAHFASLAI